MIFTDGFFALSDTSRGELVAFATRLKLPVTDLDRIELPSATAVRRARDGGAQYTTPRGLDRIAENARRLRRVNGKTIDKGAV